MKARQRTTIRFCWMRFTVGPVREGQYSSAGWYQAGGGTSLIWAATGATVVPVIGRLFAGLANLSYMDG
jgi:hypothetical protein